MGSDLMVGLRTRRESCFLLTLNRELISSSTDRATAPSWIRHNRWFGHPIPPELKSWLLDAGSLTDRLKENCSHSFEVNVLTESWRRPRLDEALKLDIRLGTVGWIREVQLVCDGSPRVFARTVIPARTLTGDERRLARLGNRSLGAALFTTPGTERDGVELARIEPHQAMYNDAIRCIQDRPSAIWGRRSVFRMNRKPLLVTELFLPGS